MILTPLDYVQSDCWGIFAILRRNQFMLTRRQALKSLATIPLLNGCIIRSIAGLRPFRPSGFVVNVQKMNEKIIIHNYGHGGSGIILSWGTSHLAMELANKTGFKRSAIFSCGAAGLCSARAMQTARWDFTIYAKDLTPNTT